MTPEIVKNQIIHIKQRLMSLCKILDNLSTADFKEFTKESETCITNAALRAEAIACRLRLLLFMTTTVKPEEYYSKANLELGIDVSYEDGVFTVVLPGLLPKKRSSQSTPYLLEPLQYALLGFVRSHGKPKFRECTVNVEHMYDEHFPASAIRDYDNLQLKKVLDMITLFTMTDDTGRLCNLYQTMRLGNSTCTRICVMANDRFSDWLKGKKQG